MVTDEVLDAAVVRLVESGITPGLQVAAIAGDRHWRCSRGVAAHDAELTDESFSPLFCTTKLLTTATVLVAAGEGLVDLDAPLSSWLTEAPPSLEEVSLSQLMSFRSGLWGDRAEQLMMLPPASRAVHVLAMRRRRVPDGGGVYSEYAAHHLAGLAVEAATGERIGDLARRLVLGPAGLASEISLGQAVPPERLAISLGRTRAGRLVPWLAEGAAEFTIDGSCANGGYGTARGVARLLHWLRPPTNPERFDCMARPMTERRHDPVLRRTCRHGMGTWFGLRDHAFPEQVGENSYGLAGLGGAFTAMFDPDAELAVAWRDTVVHESLDDLLRIRHEVVAAAYETLNR